MTTIRRNRPGTKARDFFKWPDESFEEMESTLSYQQFIQQSIRNDPHNIEAILNLPESLDQNRDSGIWKYEHIRQFCIELNSLFIKMQEVCLPEECPQMSATSQCIYLCASHKTPKECPAIIYTRHTLDGGGALLNVSKYFPSRVNFKESSLNKLESICRRIYRIFGHAYYHHRAVYDDFESKTSLCQRFTLFVLRYNLMPQDNIIVPIGTITDTADIGPLASDSTILLRNGDDTYGPDETKIETEEPYGPEVGSRIHHEPEPFTQNKLNPNEVEHSTSGTNGVVMPQSETRESSSSNEATPNGISVDVLPPATPEPEKISPQKSPGNTPSKHRRSSVGVPGVTGQPSASPPKKAPNKSPPLHQATAKGTSSTSLPTSGKRGTTSLPPPNTKNNGPTANPTIPFSVSKTRHSDSSITNITPTLPTLLS